MDKVERFLKRKKFNDIQSVITDRHKFEILKIINKFENDGNFNRISNRLQNIYYFIIYDVDGCWLERIEKIKILGSDITSELALEVRYGKHGKEHLKKTIDKMKNTLENFISRYGEEVGKVKYSEYREKNRFVWGLENCIKKYGKIEGPKKWDIMLNKKIQTQNEVKKNKKYRNGRTLLEYIERYGEIDGKAKWLERNNKQKFRFSEEYYITKYGIKIGKIKWLEYCKNNDKVSKVSLIKRYGEDVGEIKYNEYVSKAKKFNSIDNYILKYGEELGTKKWFEFLDKIRFKNIKYSKISQELFWSIYDEIKKFTSEGEIYFAELNKEYFFNVKRTDINLNCINVDFKYLKKIIEFDGDYWHSSKRQIELDKKRDKFLKSKGYDVLRIKECDYKKNKSRIVKKCIKFLKK